MELRLRVKLALAVSLSLVVAAPAGAQVRDPEAWRATRAELEAHAQSLERTAASTAYAASTRARALEQLATVRRRLVAGDFSVGERVLVAVRGATVNVTDTLPILDSLILSIPNIRRVSVAGVLRSELEPLVAREVAEVVRGASVRATSLMRVAVLGEVARPGYLSAPPETLLDQLLTQAGGLTGNADLSRATIVRGDTVVVETNALRRAIAAGQTIAAMDLRSGDALSIPTRRAPWDRASTLGIVSLVLGPIITALLIR